MAADVHQVPIGVLLPLRLETRFQPGRLLLRVVPDEPWFARHDPLVSGGEVDALGRYLATSESAAGTPDPEGVRAQAWRELVSQVGGARAVYLLRTFTTTDAGGKVSLHPPKPDELRDEPTLPRIEGFPKQLHVWLARAGKPPQLAVTLDVDRDRLLADFPDPDLQDDRRWWEDWKEAQKAGLGVDLALDGNPDDIDALFVTGLGEDHPGALLANHRDGGRIGLLSPGTATNTVDGAPAAGLGQDADTWRDVLRTPASDTDRLVSRALSGDPDLLGNLPGPSEPHRAMASSLVAALWPALWGSAADDVWALTRGKAGPEAPAWAEAALYPEGPFPIVRVGSQPYGMLPATVLGRWKPDAQDPLPEEPLIAPLLALRDRYRDAATARGNVVGASPEQLLDLMGQLPTSPHFRHRLAWPLELWWLAFGLVGGNPAWASVDRDWHGRYRLADELGLEPVRRYGARHAPGRLRIPLVVPERLPADVDLVEVLKRLIEVAERRPAAFARSDILQRELLQLAPDSLFLRLVIRSLQVVIGNVGRELAREQPPGPEPVVRSSAQPGRLEAWIAAVRDTDLQATTPATTRFHRVVAALIESMGIDPARLERLLTATVDTAAFRIDPWLVGIPTRRLDALQDAGEAVPRLGAYGWVDRPRPGTPGPTAAGLLHAPSPGQALTAAVIRDRAVNDPSPDRWQLDLTSASVRAADRLAEHVRMGAHLADAAGREVERIVGLAADVDRLRATFPVRTEHEGRRVCDGLAVLAAPPATLGLDQARLDGLEGLRAALEAYGDLLVAEAVHHVTQGRAEVAGAVMDAAAGLSRPPRLDLLRTSRHGRAVATSVVVALAAVPEPDLPADPVEAARLRPSTLADAATAAFVADQLGTGDAWTFDVAVMAAPGEPGAGQPLGPRTTVNLDDLDLIPGDALALTVTDLTRLAAAAGAAALNVDEGRTAVDGGTAVDLYERAARLVGLVGKLPATPDALTETADAAVDLRPVADDLARRYGLAHGALTALSGLLAGAVGDPDPDRRRSLLVAASWWGVAPEVPAGPDAAALTADERLELLVGRAREVLAGRLATAPAPADAPTLGQADLVEALVALVSPTGQLAVTSRLPAAALPALQAAPTGGPVALDQAWLPVVAAVRERLARVEVHQLAAPTAAGGGEALQPWSNKPSDPWQQVATDGRRLIVAYAAGGLDLAALAPAGPVAIAVVDRFTEVVPDEPQTTGAAFGFDAPAARAPQAILLAVPPATDEGLDARTVMEIVAEARDLARARMARPVDLPPELAGLLPSALLPASGATAVPLEPSER